MLSIFSKNSVSRGQVKILVVCHNKTPHINAGEDLFIPIQAGKALSNVDLGILSDDTGQNISDRNRAYAELTATYWAWKNMERVDFIGLCHYRRFFDFRSNAPYGIEQFELTEKLFLHRKQKHIIPRSFSKYDVVLPQSRIIAPNIWEEHTRNEPTYWYNLLLDVIRLKYPDYEESVDYFFHHCPCVPQRNMFLMRWDIFEGYCEWLFSILFSMEDIAVKSGITSNDRELAIIGEMLLPLYVYHNGYSVLMKSLLYITDTPQNSWRQWKWKMKTMFKYLNLNKRDFFSTNVKNT